MSTSAPPTAATPANVAPTRAAVTAAARLQQRRHRNIATFAALLLFVVLVYAVTLVRVSGHA